MISELLLATALAQSPAPSASKEAPKCVRPSDMSRFEAVKTFVECEDKKKAFCEKYEKDPECRAKPSLRFPGNPDDISPAERCKIGNDNSYSCIQDPIRFVPKEVPLPGVPSQPIDEENKPADPAAAPPGAQPAEAGPPPQVLIPPPPPPVRGK